MEGKDPLVIGFLVERITYVGRTETERKPYQYRVSLRYVERNQQNAYGLVVTSVEQTEIPTGFFRLHSQKINSPNPALIDRVRSGTMQRAGPRAS